jgi:cytoskeletal protein CcmA (bactofilin family)
MKLMSRKCDKTSNGSMNTIIGENSKLEGQFDIGGSIKIEGSVKGRLHASERLVVGEGGSVTGNVTVRDAIIGGEFVGEIIAESRIELESTAKVRADIKTVHLVIQEGAVFRGNIESGEGEFAEESERVTTPYSSEQNAAEAE